MAQRPKDGSDPAARPAATGPARPEMAESDLARRAESAHEAGRPETPGASPGTGSGAGQGTSGAGMPPAAPPEVLDAIRDSRGWFIGLGIALIVAGLAALLFPLVASIAAKVMIGWLMLIAGAVTLWHAFQTRSWGSTLWNALIGILSLAVGVYLAFFPLTGLIGLTLILGATFAAQGVFECLVALQNRDRRGWVWVLASGVLSVILGLVLLFGLPGTAAWALGLMVGIHFVTSGASLLALVRAA